MDRSLLEPIGVDSGLGARWMVVIYNNESNSVDEVVSILIEATGCSFDEAMIEMWEAHNLGNSSVHFASHEECAAAAALISSIGVRAEVKPEWV